MAEDKPKRRQQSSIDRLPGEIRERLEELLRDPAWTQLDATDEVNELMENQGLSYRLSKSAVNRYFQRMEKIGGRIREGRMIADMWIAKLGNEPQGKVGMLLNEVVRNLAFETAMSLGEGDEPAPPKALKELAEAVEKLERASTTNQKRDQEIRKQALEQAAKQVEETAVAKGMGAEEAKFWREQVFKAY